MKNAVFIILLPSLLAGCSQSPRTPYAEAYREARSELHGCAPVTEAMVDRFVRFFSDAGLPAHEVYGEPLYFSDTLITTRDRDTALRHLERMKSASEELSVEVIDTRIEGEDAYVVWQMRATFSPALGQVESNTVGVTHLRFSPDGRIILQQDFWDSAEGLYSHLPVLGSLIAFVKSRFQVEER